MVPSPGGVIGAGSLIGTSPPALIEMEVIISGASRVSCIVAVSGSRSESCLVTCVESSGEPAGACAGTTDCHHDALHADLLDSAGGCLRGEVAPSVGATVIVVGGEVAAALRHGLGEQRGCSLRSPSRRAGRERVGGLSLTPGAGDTHEVCGRPRRGSAWWVPCGGGERECDGVHEQVWSWQPCWW